MLQVLKKNKLKKIIHFYGEEGIGKSAFLLNLAYFISDRKYEHFKYGVILIQNLSFKEF